MTFTFSIPGRLSSQNEVIRNAAYNRYGGGAKRKKEKEHCYWGMVEQMGKLPIRFTRPVTISFAWIEPNSKRDIDNIAAGGTKVIIDAMVMAKIIPNDTREWVKGISHTFPPPDKANPRVEVTIEEMTPEGRV
jgi:Holliday junction resolvase RusA-like endonuclease